MATTMSESGDAASLLRSSSREMPLIFVGAVKLASSETVYVNCGSVRRYSRERYRIEPRGRPARSPATSRSRAEVRDVRKVSRGGRADARITNDKMADALRATRKVQTSVLETRGMAHASSRLHCGKQKIAQAQVEINMTSGAEARLQKLGLVLPALPATGGN